MPTPLTTPIPDDAEYRQLAAIASDLLGPDARIGNSWNGTQLAFLSQRDAWDGRLSGGFTQTEFARRLNAAFPHIWNPKRGEAKRRRPDHRLPRQYVPNPGIDDAIRAAFIGPRYGAARRAMSATSWSRLAVSRRACELGLVAAIKDYRWSPEKQRVIRIRGARPSR